MKLENKKVIITGGASGMGKATAELFCNEGATVAMEAMNVGDTMGTYQYVMRWDNLVDWGISKDKLNTSAEWAALGEKYTPGELGEMTSSLSGVNLDSSVKASDFSDPFVYSVQVWDPTPGKIQELLSNFMMAKSMIEATGAPSAGSTPIKVPIPQERKIVFHIFL